MTSGKCKQPFGTAPTEGGWGHPSPHFLSRAQRGYRMTRGRHLTRLAFLDQRLANPDLVIAGALNAVADSLAAHFGDWGAASRFTIGDAADSPRMPGSDEPIGFEQDIKPLFRDLDRDSMRFSFDLWSLEDVSTHADAILQRLDAGTMPCDGAWPADRVAVFRHWIDAGKPA